MKYCTKCGAPMKDDALFCTACGHRAGSPEAPQTEAPVPQQAQEPFQSAAPQQGQNPDYGAAPQQGQNPNYGAAPQQGQNPGFGTVYNPDSQYMVPPQKPPRRKRKLTWLWITLGVLAAVAAAVCIWFFCIRKTPEEKLASAITSTSEASQDLLKHSKNLKKMGEFITKPENTGRVAFSCSGEDAAIDMEILSDTDLKNKRMGEEIRYTINTEGKTLPMRLQMYMDQEEVQFALPDLSAEVFSMSPEDAGLGKDWLDHYETLEEKGPDNVEKALEETLKVEEVETETRLVAGEERSCQIYHINLNSQALSGVSSLLASAPVANLKYSFIVSDGLLRGFLLSGQEAGGRVNIELLLDGEENPYSHVLMKVNGRTVMEMKLEATDSGIRISLLLEGEEIGTIVYDDDEKTLTITADGEEMVFLCGIFDNEAHFEMGTDEFDLAMTMGPNQEVKAEPLSDSPLNLSNLSESDKQRIVMDIITALAENPDTSWILDSLIDMT